jgi:predicted transcriptional regulator
MQQGVTRVEQEQVITLTADIVSAHVANNTVAVGDLPTLIRNVHAALSGLDSPVEEAPQQKTPIVSARASVKPDYIVCMECGKKQKMLKRHLMTAHSMTPDQYRKDYGLSADYPMTAANYSAARADLARSIGLGRMPRKGAQGGDAAAGKSAGTGGRGRRRAKA